MTREKRNLKMHRLFFRLYHFLLIACATTNAVVDRAQTAPRICVISFPEIDKWFLTSTGYLFEFLTRCAHAAFTRHKADLWDRRKLSGVTCSAISPCTGYLCFYNAIGGSFFRDRGIAGQNSSDLVSSRLRLFDVISQLKPPVD